jgi:citrate lyase subunit beta/citryl-CoA lyase
VAVESARGLINAPDLAAIGRVVGLILGSEDYALDLGLSVMRESESRELLYARSALVVAARGSGVMAIDGVFPDFKDLEGLHADAGQARRLGFTGKSLFHPNQIDEINATFSPSPEELRYAGEVVAAFREAESRGDGAVAVGGQLVDLPILRRAERILGALESEARQ